MPFIKLGLVHLFQKWLCRFLEVFPLLKSVPYRPLSMHRKTWHKYGRTYHWMNSVLEYDEGLFFLSFQRLLELLQVSFSLAMIPKETIAGMTIPTLFLTVAFNHVTWSSQIVSRITLLEFGCEIRDSFLLIDIICKASKKMKQNLNPKT